MAKFFFRKVPRISESSYDLPTNEAFGFIGISYRGLSILVGLKSLRGIGSGSISFFFFFGFSGFVVT
jgi:hypothetical protein